MKFNYLSTLCFAAFVLVGCSKPEAVLSEIKNKDLGVVNLTYGVPATQDIGNGLSCVLIANPMNSTSCELIVKISRSGKVIDARRMIPTPLDKPNDLTFENAHVTFTPHVAQ